jgi:hypothetical protein
LATKFHGMNNNRLMQQVTAIFSLFMVFFYLGAGFYLVLFKGYSYINRAVWVIAGSTFILVGLYRAYQTYVKIVEAFFNRNKKNE